MSIPSRTEAATLLRGLAPSEKLLNHCAAVAEVAAFICAAMTRLGVAVNAPLAESAALLHDLDKALPATDAYRALGHGSGGAAWLSANGHAELSELVAQHPVFTLGNAASYEAWAAQTGLEGRVVSYADKRAMHDVVSLDERFEYWYGRYPGGAMLPLAHERARQLEREICAAAGIGPAEVRRLAWVDDAMRAHA